MRNRSYLTAPLIVMGLLVAHEPRGLCHVKIITPAALVTTILSLVGVCSHAAGNAETEGGNNQGSHKEVQL